MESNEQLNLMMLGGKGAGKSTAANTILGQQAFTLKADSSCLTEAVLVESGTVYGCSVTVYDTPGLFDTDLSEEEIQQKLENVLQRCESGPSAFLLVIKADRCTEEERKTVEKIEKLLGEKRLNKTWILFTRGDKLEDENMTIDEFINNTEQLKRLVQKYDQRYHLFNNKSGASDQARLLLLKILQSYLGVMDGGRLVRMIPDRPNTCDEQQIDVFLPSTQIVLLGKTGVGKSAAGNTILGQKEFRAAMKMSSVTSECSEKHTTVSGRSVSVIDTPGFFDTQMKPDELSVAIARSVYLSSPGPHAFLIVFNVNMRFTEHEQQIPQMIEMMFGQQVLKYSIILFTFGDLLEEETIEELIEENSRLRHLVQLCGGRFHVFKNKDQNNREQVNDLLQKIDTMIEQNGGGRYSNQMFTDAHRFRQEEEKRKQQEKQKREEIERVRKETEERTRAEIKAQKFEIEELRKHAEETERELTEKLRMLEAQRDSEFKQFYRKYERKFRFSSYLLGKSLPAIGAIIGGCIGAAFGIIGGPAGIAAGGAFGVSVGVSVGTVIMEKIFN